MSAERPLATLAAQTVWPVDRIKDHVSKIGSGITPSGGAASYLAAGIPLLRSQNVHFDGLRLDDVAYIAEETHEEMGGTRLRPGDVLLNITGASIGRCAFVPDGFGEGNVNQHVCIIRPSAKLDYRFLTYCLSAPWGQDQVFSSFTGASRQGLGQRDLGDIQVPLPPLPEQQRIAAYLDASCAAIDAAVAAKRRQLETLGALRTTLVYEAVTQGINPSVVTIAHDIPSYGRTPRHWKRSKLRYEISIQNGDFASDKLQDTGAHPVLGGNGVMGHADLSNVDGETVVIGRVGAYCGNAHHVQGKAWVSDNALIAKSGHHARFLCHLFNALNFNAQANNTAQPVITGTKIKNTYVVLPPPAEQEAICGVLDTKLAEVERIVTSIETQIATLTTYRKSLIHECVTGQRRITEADMRRAGGCPSPPGSLRSTRTS
jgi:type I restriction enzyme S subunit